MEESDTISTFVAEFNLVWACECDMEGFNATSKQI